jgi:hypothetical protein
MNQRKFLTGMAIASFLIPSIGLTTIQTNGLAIAAPTKLSKATSRKPFYSKAGRFSIDFPGKPTPTIDKNTATGQPMDGFQVIISKQAIYKVWYQDSSGFRNLSREKARKMLASNELVTGILKGLNTTEFKTKFLNSKSIQISNNPGQEIDLTMEVTRSNKTFQLTGKLQMCIVGERMYMVMQMNFDGSQKKNSAFFDSFRVYEKSEML